MHIEPPNLLPSPPADQTSPIVDHALGFGVENDTHCMQPCVYPQVEDTCTVEHFLDADIDMEDAPMDSSMAESKDAIEIECVLWNASIGGYKDAFLAFRSTDDDENEGGGEDQVDARMSDNLSFNGVGFAGASHESDSNPLECSR